MFIFKNYFLRFIMQELNMIEVEEVNGGLGFGIFLIAAAIAWITGAEMNASNSGGELNFKKNIPFSDSGE